MSPLEVVECWVERFNAGDVGGLADLYHPDAVNHRVTQEPVEGRDAIRAMFEREFASADMTCIVEAIHEAGDVHEANSLGEHVPSHVIGGRRYCSSATGKRGGDSASALGTARLHDKRKS